ncbi:hypothetical protein [Nocardioides sp.]|uniref:hypothetical protein n=1 Tax=Nocardioides sp. TaxID=35761 RepID=UPI0039E4FA1A
MSEGDEPAATAEDELAGEPVRTGVAAVDAVLAEVDGIGDLPLEEHVGVFERAHDQLRRALDADPDSPA